MRFFVRVDERETRDPQEEVAMIRHRLNSIQYLMKLLQDQTLEYAFRSDDNRSTMMLVRADSLEDLDRIIKADPAFPYSEVDVMPVVSTPTMVREIQDYLGEQILTEEELAELEPTPVDIDPNGNYFLTTKTQLAFSALLPEEEQRDIYRRTVIAQRRHNSPIEVSDYNPVGKAWGILIAKCERIDEVQRHVEMAEIYPDTKVETSHIQTLQQSWRSSINRLEQLRPGTKVAAEPLVITLLS
jgi:muconolactone delta-isomerase